MMLMPMATVTSHCPRSPIGSGNGGMGGKSECPYGAETCPKMDELDEKVTRLDTMMCGMQRTLWVIAGILMCECGIMVL